MAKEQSSQEEGKLVGKITHYFGNINVAVIDTSDVIKVGDTIRVVGGEIDFTQPVESMEVDRKKSIRQKSAIRLGS